MSSQQVSVIICAYSLDRCEDLVDAVRSVQQQTVQADQIIVVVDHNPTLLAWVREKLTGVAALENAEPQGLAGARNSGLGIAEGDIIAFLDDDAVAEPDWLARLRQGYEDPMVSGVGGAISASWLCGRPSWFPDEFDWVVGCTYRGMPETTAPVRNLIGANMSFRRSIFEAVGGFRSGIGRVGTRPVGCEETELCIRTSQHFPGMHFLYEPEARISHRVPPTRATWTYFRRRCHSEGLSKVLVSHYVGPVDGLASERAYTFATLPRGVARGIGRAFFHGDWAGLSRAGVILVGLMITTAGFVTGHVSTWFSLDARSRNRRSPPTFQVSPRTITDWSTKPSAIEPAIEAET